MTDRYLTVVGDPIEHSLSPLIHSIAYEFLGLDWSYERNLVSQGGLNNFVRENPKYSALSVTMPLKDEAFEFSDTRSEEASLTKVVNTLVKTTEGWQGYNTDVFGIKRALVSATSPTISTAAILGAGATARSAVLAVSQLYPRCKISVYARDISKAANVGAVTKVDCQAFSLADYESASELVINTTPVDLLPSQSRPRYWMNTSYSGHDLSMEQGFINGLEMLLWQAIAQIRIFTSSDQNRELEREGDLVPKLRKALNLP